ncbi:MAG: amidohydrolase family protein [Spirochaetia bacterium]|nr:amidohydrolase family protein [Spirochaetia bacterium]
MDQRRRILRDAAILIKDNRIHQVGTTLELKNLLQEASADKVIDAAGKVVLPGLIDSHAHAGHGLTKTLGEGGNRN